MSAADAPAVEVRGLKTAFGAQVVHDGLDLTVRKGEVLAEFAPVPPMMA